MQTVKLVVQTLIVISGIALISACGTSSSHYAVQASVTPASVVIVNQSLEIPNKKARVYIQDGAQTAKRDLDPWRVYCSLLMQQLHSAGEPKLSVLPGQFEITKVRAYKERQNFPGTFVASTREWQYVPPIVIFRVEMRLNSAQQADVRSLICAKQVESYGHHYPTIEEMRAALGNTVAIKMP
jgi:hypothetical protein